jgi:hypothetical protein
MSSIVACAPSKRTVPPPSRHVPGELRGVGDVLLEAVAVGQVLLGHRLQVEARVLAYGRSDRRLGSIAATIFFLRIFSSRRSCTRMPRRAALSA